MSEKRNTKPGGLFWAPQIPAHWSVRKLAHLVSLQSGEMISGDLIKDEGTYPVYGGGGFRGYTENLTHRGDHILIGRQGALCGNVTYAQGPLWATEHSIVATAKEPFVPLWLASLLRAMNLGQYSTSAAQPGIAAEVIGGLRLPFPPLHEQAAIADFLSKETTRIDALVAEKERLLGFLAEKRRALITQAVTRGLRADAPLRDSGLPWLGSIPAQWKLARSKWLFTERDDRSLDGSETLLSLRMERGLVPHNDVSEKQTREEELIGYKKISAGEIVINRMRAASGLVAISSQEGLVSPDYAVFRCSAEINQAYYTHLFKTEILQAVFRSESTGMGTGSSGFLRLYSESFLALWLPVPPLSEQRAIVAHIETKTTKLDQLRSSAERTIALLKERRAALIAAAVTGQITIPARS